MLTIDFVLFSSLSGAPNDSTCSEVPLWLHWSAASLPVRSWNLLPSGADTESGTCNDFFFLVLFSGTDHFTISLIQCCRVSLILPIKVDSPAKPISFNTESHYVVPASLDIWSKLSKSALLCSPVYVCLDRPSSLGSNDYGTFPFTSAASPGKKIVFFTLLSLQ